MENTDRIKTLFKSNDISAQKLAQKICHKLRISYYIAVWDAWLTEYKRPIGYYLESPELKFSTTEGEMLVTIENQHRNLRIYKINLDGTTAQAKYQHCQTSSDVWEEVV